MIRALVLALLFVANAAPARADDLGRIIARYVAWRGGTAFEAMHTMAANGTATDGKLSGTVSFAANARGDLNEALAFGPLQTETDVAGPHGRVVNLSGQALPLSAPELSFAHDLAGVLLPVALEHTASPQLLAPSTFDGAPVAVLRVQRDYGSSDDYLVSPQDGALRAVRLSNAGGTRVLAFSDWRQVDGVRVPFTIRESGPGSLGPFDEDALSLAFRSVVPRAPAVAAPVRAAASLPRFAAGADSSGPIPFRLVDNLIVLDVAVNGRKVAAILDSGAGLTCLDAGFAHAIGARPVGGSIVYGSGGSTSMSYAPGVGIEIGALSLPGIAAGVIDLAGMSKLSPTPLRVILGAEIFNQLAVDINYPHRLVTFRAPQTAPREVAHQPGGSVLPLGTFDAAFTLPISANGRTPILVQIDTGSDGGLQLFPAAWHRQTFPAGSPWTEILAGGVGGFMPHREVDLARLALDTTILRDVPTALLPPGTQNADDTVMLGNLGGAILRRFRVIFDVPDGRITLLPGPDVQAPFARNLVGLEIVPDGRFGRVIFVMPNSPAAAAKLRVGDEIVTVDGRSTDVAGMEWEEGKVGDHITLVLRDGRHLTLKEQRFY